MTYEEALEAEEITRATVLAELRRHAVATEEFFADLGDRSAYSGAEVLAWLGY